MIRYYKKHLVLIIVIEKQQGEANITMQALLINHKLNKKYRVQEILSLEIEQGNLFI